jgi:hypothetical protein
MKENVFGLLHTRNIITRGTAVGVIAFLLNGLSSVYGFIGEGIRVGDAILDPFVEISGTGDSNVPLASTNKQSDVFVELQAGLQLHYEPGWYTIDGRGFGLFRRYTKFTDRGFDNFGERVSLMSGNRDTLSVLLMQGYRLVNDYDRSTYYSEIVNPESQNLSLAYDKSMRIKRALSDAGIVLGRQVTDKIGMNIGFSYGSQAYKTNDVFDVVSLLGHGDLSYLVTDKSSVFVGAEYGTENNGSFAEDGTTKAIFVGVETKSTDKMTMRASAGEQEYTRSAVLDPSKYADKDVEVYTGPRDSTTKSLDANLTATWIATEKISVEISGRTGLQSAQQYVNTINKIAVGSANAVYQLNDSTSVSLTGAYREDSYVDPVIENGIQYDRVDRRIAGLLRADYRAPAQFLTIFGEGGYEKARSTIPDFNYDQLRLSIGVTVRY